MGEGEGETQVVERSRAAAMDRLRFALGALLIFAASSPGLMFLGASDDPKAPETPLLRLLWLPVYLGVLGLCALSWRRLARAWAPAALCAAMCAWAWASQRWSIAPDVTHRRAIALVMTTLLGLALGAGLGGRRLAEALAGVVLVLAVGSAVVALADPRIGVMTLDGGRDWRGLWTHKNALAFVMAQGALAATCAAFAAPARRRLWLATTAVCLAVLVMSRGKSSLLAVAVVIVGAGGLALMRRNAISAVVAAWCAATAVGVAVLAAVLAPASVLKALGKDPTLTGRTDIWAAVARRIAERPLTGYGYGAFWEKTSAPARIVRKEANWPVPSAHNGWLDLLLQVGWIGAALFAATAMLALVALSVRAPRSRDGGFGLFYLLLFLILAMSESVIEEPNTLPWALVVAVITCALSPRAQLASAAPRRAAAAPPPLWRPSAPQPAAGLFVERGPA